MVQLKLDENVIYRKKKYSNLQKKYFDLQKKYFASLEKNEKDLKESRYELQLLINKNISLKKKLI